MTAPVTYRNQRCTSEFINSPRFISNARAQRVDVLSNCGENSNKIKKITYKNRPTLTEQITQPLLIFAAYIIIAESMDRQSIAIEPLVALELVELVNQLLGQLLHSHILKNMMTSTK
jgi:hypothetical protein